MCVSVLKLLFLERWRSRNVLQISRMSVGLDPMQAAAAGSASRQTDGRPLLLHQSQKAPRAHVEL